MENVNFKKEPKGNARNEKHGSWDKMPLINVFVSNRLDTAEGNISES